MRNVGHKDTTLGGQPPEQVEGFGRREQRLPVSAQRLLVPAVPAQLREPDGLVGQRPGQVGGERVGAGGRPRPANGDGLGAGGQRFPWGNQWTWEDCQAWYKAQHPEAYPPPPAPRPPRDATATRSADEIEEWAKSGIDDEIDDVETDPPGTRNDRLNKRALRCFRLALLADYDLDDVYDALVDACHVNGLIADDGIGSVRKTLNSARRKAIEDGPCDPPRDRDNVTYISRAMFPGTRTKR